MSRLLLREIAAGSLLILGGLAFSFSALKYQLGTFSDMAPGMFPFIVGLLIALTGVPIIIDGLTNPKLRSHVVSEEGSSAGKADGMRSFLLVIGALALFGITIQPFGMVPAVIALVLLIGLAEQDRKPLQSLLIAVALAALATVIFIFGLGMNIPAFAWSL
jgi:hypothetical protein